ncbi:hypothetical protein [Desertivirga arenae]|uniref:hypothetical protein n=1 Tax=Desertivirga arenae TaxID=2810309 RepID=UPI001A963881|nr:hypothetical protein [Pedobacter sp. SYSU D00823]
MFGPMPVPGSVYLVADVGSGRGFVSGTWCTGVYRQMTGEMTITSVKGYFTGALEGTLTERENGWGICSSLTKKVKASFSYKLP